MNADTVTVSAFLSGGNILMPLRYLPMQPHEHCWTFLQDAHRPIILYGTGDGADKVLDELERRHIPIQGIMASDDFVRGQTFRGFTVRRLSDLVQQYTNPVILIAFGSQRPEVISHILDLAEKYTVLCADVPVYGTNIFNEAFFAQYQQEIEQAAACWEDDISRQVYDNIIRFKLSGKLSYLTAVFSDKDEAFYQILCLHDHESYLDLGAYRGDTIDEFLHYTNGQYQQITALEPDRKNYRKLREYTASLEHIQTFRMGIWSKDTDLYFDGALGRGSSIQTDGNHCIPVTTIDTLYRKRPLTYLKIDVEGAEEQALLGGRTVLQRDKPKLNLALYHRSEDIFKLPLLLKEINPSYRLYLRQHPHIPAWDSNLYAR